MLEKLSQLNSTVFFLLLFLALFLVAWFLSAVWNRLKAMAAAAKGRGAPANGLSMLTTLFLFMLVLIVLLVMAVSRIYTAFAAHDLVAVVECHPARDFGRDAFAVNLTRVIDGQQQEPESFVVRGDDWSLGGDILEWQKFMTAVGFKSMYRLTRLQGRYTEATAEMTEAITAHPLVAEEKSTFWEILYRIAVKSPFIKSAHQNYVAAHPFYGSYFEVYVTPTGYTLERFDKNAAGR